MSFSGKSQEQWDNLGSGTSTFVLNSVDAESFGHYRCSAHNHLGSNSTLLTLAGKWTKILYNLAFQMNSSGLCTLIASLNV